MRAQREDIFGESGAQQGLRAMSRRRPWRTLVALCIGLPIVFKAGDILVGQNFHTVEAGAVYRSAQLSGSTLGHRARDLGIKSVLNLRGPGPGKDWYDDELRASECAEMHHYDIALSARALPSPDSLAQVVTVIQQAPRPLLIHCKNGADRSGLASAIALILDRHTPAAIAADEQLDLWYGHMPIGPTTAMDRVFELYAQAEGSPEFARWVRDTYPKVYRKETADHAH